MWLKIKELGQIAGVSPCFHLPCHFGTAFLSHSHTIKTKTPSSLPAAAAEFDVRLPTSECRRLDVPRRVQPHLHRGAECGGAAGGDPGSACAGAGMWACPKIQELGQMAGFVFGSIYQAAFFVHLFEPQPYGVGSNIEHLETGTME